MIPPQLLIILMAMAPGIELRIAIPYGILVGQVPPPEVLALAFFGSLIPLLIVPGLLSRFGGYLREHSRLFRRILEKTQAKHDKRFLEGELLALLILVALPLPMSGVWTGMFVAYLFGIRNRLAVPIIALGALIGTVAVGILTAGAGALLHL